MVGENGLVYSTKNNRGGLLKGCKNRDGYIRYNCKGGQKKFGHVLVMETFVGEKPAGNNVNHKNGIKDDNSLSNLEYTTEAENIKHAYAFLPRKSISGEKNGQAKLSNRDALEIRALLNKGISRDKIMEIYSCVSKSAIHKVASGRTFRIIS